MTQAETMQSNVERNLPHYSTEQLLALALKMLDEAAKEQARRKDKWLSGNLTLEVIRARVKANQSA